jgi:multidrug efflux system outer membrane protein
VETPNDWRVPTDTQSTIANLRWWGTFDDPVLNELIVEALVYNNDLKVAVARVSEFAARYAIVYSQLYPQIFADAQVFREKASLDFLPPGSPRIWNQFSLLGTLSYEVDLWGRIYSATEASLADLYNQIEVERGVILALVSSVAESYILLQQFDRQLAISLQTLESRKHSYDLVRLGYEGGLTGEMEPIQALSEVEAALTKVIQFEEIIEEQENLISILVGRVPGPIKRHGTIDDLHLPPSVPAGLPSELLFQRPDILGAEQQLIAANARIGEARAAFFPQITLTEFFGNQSLELSRLFTGNTQTWQFGANALQPIFTGGRLVAQVGERQAQKAEAWYGYAQTVLVAFKEVNDALIAHQKSTELLVVQKRRVKILVDYLYLAQLQFRNGESDYLTVLDAERDLFTVQLELVNAQSDNFLTYIELFRATGGGWVVDAEDLMNQLTDKCIEE